jgi:multimeric flavodoxin WrbA
LGLILFDAAKAAGPSIDIELIDLAGMSIPVCQLVGQPIPEGHADDFPKVAEKLSDLRVAGIIIGTPVYFGTMTSLCKAFIERFMHFRRNKFALGGKVGGAVAVGGARHGGQERTLQDLHAAMLSQEMVVVGDGQPTAHTGATLWNNWKDDITQDEAGMATAKNLGRRVAEVALRMSAGKR